MEERSSRLNGSQYGPRHHSRPLQPRNRHHHRPDARITNHQHHGSSWNESSRGHGLVNEFRTRHPTAHWNHSVHWNGQRRPSLVPSSSANGTESRFSQRSSVLLSRRSSAFRDRVAEHAMEMMMQRRSEVRVTEDDSFAVAVDHSS